MSSTSSSSTSNRAAPRIDYNSLASNFQNSLRLENGSPVYGSMRVQGQVPMPQGMMMKGPSQHHQQQHAGTLPMMRGSPSHSIGSVSQHSGSRVSLSSGSGHPQQQAVYENLDYYGDNV